MGTILKVIMTMEIISKVITAVLGAVLLAVVLGVIMAFPVKWCWNYVMPYLFNLREIDAWHALGLALLCGLLFGTAKASSTKE